MTGTIRAQSSVGDGMVEGKVIARPLNGESEKQFTAESDQDGAYILDLPAGTYDLKIVTTGSGDLEYFPEPRSVTVGSGEAIKLALELNFPGPGPAGTP